MTGKKYNEILDVSVLGGVIFSYIVSNISVMVIHLQKDKVTSMVWNSVFSGTF